MPDFSNLKDNYRKLWDTMTIRPDKDDLVTRIAQRLIRNKPRYQAVERQIGVPWFVVAALHNRESDADFSTYLGNGEPLNRVTRLVPKGRGPFGNWQEGAIDALTLDGLDRVTDWTPERICFETEKFNGFGYRKHGIPSPYLWSFSNHYSRGKYIGDGDFSASHVDQQCGAIPIMRRIMELEGAQVTTQPRVGPPISVPAGTAAAGTAAGAAAYALGASDLVALLIFAAFVAAGVVLFIRARRHRAKSKGVDHA